MGKKRNQAVYAGLLGALTLATPTVAGALSLTETIDEALGTPSVALVAGVGGGVALASAVCAVASAVRRSAAAREEEAYLASRPAPRHLRLEEPVVDEALAEDEVPQGSATPSHAASDYEDIAENYVRKATFKERMARRAVGVAATLHERMGAAMMEGVPVIARADGSVGDVGTSWWRECVGAASIISDSGFASDSEALAIPSDFSSSDHERLVRAAQHARAISDRVAFVDEEAYPELRHVDDPDHGDTWAAALRGLDEKIAAVAPVQDKIELIDGVGEEYSLDEPDNIEPDTDIIPFKSSDAGLEVIDARRYVDYLVEDEVARKSAAAARHGSRHFLRVLEGGSQSIPRRLLDASAADAPRHGRHFAVPQAVEA